MSDLSHAVGRLLIVLLFFSFFSLLVYTEKNQIMAISQRFLDARRPTDSMKKEEGLVPYFPLIPLDDGKALSKNADVSPILCF